MDLSRPDVSRRLARLIQSVETVKERQRWRLEAEKAKDWDEFFAVVGPPPEEPRRPSQ